MESLRIVFLFIIIGYSGLKGLFLGRKFLFRFRFSKECEKARRVN